MAGTAPVLEADGDRGVAPLHADAHRLVVQHLALLAGGAGARLVARALAPAGVAGQVGRAVGVLPALHLAVGAGQRALLVDDQAELAAAAGLAPAADHALFVTGAAEAGTLVLVLNLKWKLLGWSLY